MGGICLLPTPRPQPHEIALRLDNGSEHISQEFRQWAKAKGIELRFIQPGKPAQIAYVERFNRTVRQEWLNLTIFESIAHARETATQWLWRYNAERPNTAIGGITPYQRLAMAPEHYFEGS